MRTAFHPSVPRWALVGYWTLMFAATHWPEIDQLAPALDKVPGFDNFVHFCMYAGWAGLWWWVLTSGTRLLTKAEMICLILGGAIYALCDEVTQAFFGRQPDVLDFLTDLVGITCALLVVRPIWSRLERLHRAGAMKPQP